MASIPLFNFGYHQKKRIYTIYTAPNICQAHQGHPTTSHLTFQRLFEPTSRHHNSPQHTPHCVIYCWRQCLSRPKPRSTLLRGEGNQAFFLDIAVYRFFSFNLIIQNLFGPLAVAKIIYKVVPGFFVIWGLTQPQNRFFFNILKSVAFRAYACMKS